MIFAKLIVSLLNIFIAVFTFLCSASYYIKNGVSKLAITVFGRTIRLNMFDPWMVIPYTMKNGLKGYEEISDQILLSMAFSAGLWLVLMLISSRILRLFANKKTTLYGSSRWSTTKELKRSGLLSGIGVVMGQTDEAVYTKKKTKKPKRKPGESVSDFQYRLNKYNPDERVFHLKKEGKIITQARNNHTLIVGSTRSGKGVGVIIPTEFQWGESMIVFDPKGEGWEISANYRSRFSYTFKFEPEKPNESIHYNPLLAIRRGRQTIPDIQNLGYILIPNNEGDKDPFWANEGRKLFCAVVGYVIYCEPPEKKTFSQVYSVFSNSATLDDLDNDDKGGNDKENLSMIKQYLFYYAGKIEEYKQTGAMPKKVAEKYRNRFNLSEKERKKVEQEAKKYLDDDDTANLQTIWQDLIYFANCEDKQLSSVVSTMISNLQVIADPNVQSVTDRSDFTMEDFVYGVIDENGVRRPLSLYLCVSMSSIQRLVPLMKIFFEQAITLLCRDLDGNRPFRLLMMIDEFRQLGKMEVVEKALALSAGYGIILAIAIQSYDQLRVLYQSEAMFVDNFAFQVILRVNDEGTSQKIEKILGQGTKQHRTSSFSGNVNLLSSTSTTRNFSEVGRSLMSSEEIRTMPDDNLLIIQSGQHPYKGKKVMYYLDDRFRRFYLDKNGKKLPPPNIKENYPHPETFIWEDEKAKKENNLDKASFPGLDREGWHELLGADVMHAAHGEGEIIDSVKDEAIKKSGNENVEASSSEEQKQAEVAQRATEVLDDIIKANAKEDEKEENPVGPPPTENEVDAMICLIDGLLEDVSPNELSENIYAKYLHDNKKED